MSTSTSPAALAQDPAHATVQAVRGATAAALALIVVEWFHVEHGNLAVWTTHMVMLQYAFSSFQKGIERIVGRGLGILVGLVLLTLWRNAPVMVVVCEAVALLVFFYIYFSDRLAYTFLNAGLYSSVIIAIGRQNYEAAFPEGWQMFLAIVIGVVVANLVSWLSGMERTLAIQTGGPALWPIDPGRLWQSLNLVIAVLLAVLVTHWLALPVATTLVSVMLLTIAPDLQSTLRKGELRLAGAGLAVAYAFVALLFTLQLPFFSLSVMFLFLGMFLAGYLARASQRWSYAGVQMGLVLPMILVVPLSESGDFSLATSRVLGVVIAVGCSVLVGIVSAAIFPDPAGSRQGPASATQT
jgi:uncharacterized membrane protein YccC